MKSKTLARLSVVLLVLIGSGIVTWRYQVRKKARLRPTDSTWRLTYDVTFLAKSTSSRILVHPPQSTTHNRVFREERSHPGSGIDISNKNGKTTTDFFVTPAKTGTFEFNSHYDIHYMPQKRIVQANATPPLPVERRAFYLRSSKTIQVSDKRVKAVANSLMADKENTMLQRIFEFCRHDLEPFVDDENDAVSVLRQRRGNSLGKSRAMIALCRYVKMPARLVTGFEIISDDDAAPIYWVEVYSGKRWIPFDPFGGYYREIPTNYITIARDSFRVVTLRGDAELLSTSFKIRPIKPPVGLFDGAESNWTDILRLSRLPLGIQRTLAILLLLPFGALLNSAARSLIGFKTFGIFTPTLLALSFVFSDWKSGLILFVIMLSIAFVGRTFFDKLRLLLMPRLGLVLTTLVVVMVFCVSVLDYLHLTPSSNAVLLPVVILTMIVERFYVTTEEDGWKQAFMLSLQTIIVGTACYFILLWNTLADIILVYPELHMFTGAVFILLGRYTGYRLSELWRFKELLMMINKGTDT